MSEEQRENVPWELVPNRHLILGLLMKAFDVPELKTARLICKEWMEEATRNLLARSWLVVPNDYFCERKSERLKKLEAFKELPLFSQPPKWQISNVKVNLEYHQYFTRDDMEILTELGVLGPQVRHLLYNGVAKKKGYSKEKTLKDLLITCPNLETFKVINEENSYTDSDRFPLNDLFLKVLTENEKGHTVKDFHFIPRHFEESSLVTLETVDWASPVQLKQLSIALHFVMDNPVFWDRTRDALAKILEARKKTLETLVIQSPLSFLGGGQNQGQGQGRFVIPQLEKVKTLELAVLCADIDSFNSLPRRSIFHTTTTSAAFASFPNLQTLIILPQLVDKDSKQIEDPIRIWDLFLPGFSMTPPILSLVRLEVFASHVVALTTVLFTVCPNVSQLKLHCIFDLTALARDFLWTSSHLQKKLKVLDLEILHGGDETNFPEFDATLTGICPNAVMMLKGLLDTFKEDEEMTASFLQSMQRDRPSLRSLQGLEKLHLTFFGNLCDDDEIPPLILSRVTGELAFKLMPKLKVDILYKDENECIDPRRFKDALADIEPFANVKIVRA